MHAIKTRSDGCEGLLYGVDEKIGQILSGLCRARALCPAESSLDRFLLLAVLLPALSPLMSASAQQLPSAGLFADRLAAGWDHVCVVHDDTTVRCVGAGDVGQLGHGETASSAEPVRVLRRLGDGKAIALSAVRQVVADGNSSCVLGDGAVVWCWGEGFSEYAQEFTWSTGLPDPGKVADVDIDFAARRICLLLERETERTIWCGDFPSAGGLPTAQLQRIGNLPESLLQLDLGSGYGCTLFENIRSMRNRVACWGEGTQGQLGDGRLLDSALTTRVRRENGSLLQNVVQLSTGRRHACALTADGMVHCWGYNAHGAVSGELVGAEISSTAVLVRTVRESVATPLAGPIQILAAADFSCGLWDESRGVRCWGLEGSAMAGGGFGNFGDGPAVTGPFTVSTAVLTVSPEHPPLQNLQRLAAAPSAAGTSPGRVWAADSSGQLWYWGLSGLAEVPAEEPARSMFLERSSYATQLPDFGVAVAGAESQTPVLTVDEIVYLTGQGPEALPLQVDVEDQYGLPYPLNDVDLRLEFSELVAIDIDQRSHRLQLEDGRVYLGPALRLQEGRYSGELVLSLFVGDTMIARRHIRLRAANLLAVGLLHACAVHYDTTVYCLGSGSAGQLGRGSIEDSRSPVRVLRLTADDREIALVGIRQLVSGISDSCALARTGSIWCWGSRFFGYARQLRLTAATESVVDATYLDVEGDSLCLIRRDGTLWCGDLSDLDARFQMSLQRIEGIRSARQLSLGRDYGCALSSAKEVFCWGTAAYGQLGHGLVQDSTSRAVQVMLENGRPLTNISRLSAGFRHVCALSASSEGQAYCWGFNREGAASGEERRVAEVSSRAVTVGFRGMGGSLSALSGLSQLVAAVDFSCGLRTADAGVHCWGRQWRPGDSGFGTYNFGVGSRNIESFTLTTDVLLVQDQNPPLRNIQLLAGSPSAFGTAGRLPGQILGISARAARVWALDTTGTIWFWGANTFSFFGSGKESFANPIPDFNLHRNGLRIASAKLVATEIERTPGSGESPRVAVTVEAEDQFGLPYPLADSALRLEISNLDVAESSHTLRFVDGRAQMVLSLDPSRHRLDGSTVLKLTGPGEIEYDQQSLQIAAAMPSTVTLQLIGEAPRQSLAGEQLSLSLRVTVQNDFGRPSELSGLVLAIAADNGAELTTERVMLSVGADGGAERSFGVKPRGRDSVVTVQVVSGLPAGVVQVPPAGLRIPLRAAAELRSLRIELLGERERAVFSAEQQVDIRLRMTPEFVAVVPTQTVVVVQVLPISNPLGSAVLTQAVTLAGTTSTVVSLSVTLGEGRQTSTFRIALQEVFFVGVPPPTVHSPDRVTLQLVPRPDQVELDITDMQLQALQRGGEVQTTATVLANGVSQLFPLRELRLQYMVSGPAASLIVEPEPFVLRSSGSPVSLRLRLRQSYAAAEGERSTVTLTVHLAAFPQLRLGSAELVLLAAAATPSTVTLQLAGEAPRQSQPGELLSPRVRVSVRDNYGRPVAWPPLLLTIAADNEAELATSRLTVAVGPDGVGESSFGVTPRGLDSLVTVRILSPLAMDPAEGLRFRAAAAIDIVAEDRSGLLTVGFDHACVVHRDTTVRCSGAGSLGRLGNGGTADSTTPVRVLRLGADGQPIALAGIRRVVSGSRYSCALVAEGSVWCWGEGFSQYAEAIPLGTGPARLEDVKYLDVEASMGCAIRATGQVWCWDLLQRPFEPRRIEAIDDALLLSLGVGYGCALTESREVFCWGVGTFGQLGDGRMTDSLDTGRRVVLENGEPLAEIIRLSAGLIHVCALSAAGGVFCWGDNTQGSVSGEAILGDTFIVPAAVAVREFRAGIERPLSGFSMVAAGAAFSCGIQAAGGRVRCWGQEEVLSFPLSFGAFGDGRALDLDTIRFRITTAVLTVADGHPALGDLRLVAASPGERRGGDNRGFPGYKVWALDALGDLWSWGVSDYERELLSFLRFRSRQGLSTATVRFTEDLHYAARLGDFNIYRGGVELSSVTMTVAATMQQRMPGSALMVPVQVDASDQYGLPYPLEVPGLRLEISELTDARVASSSHTLRFVDGRARFDLGFELLRGGADGSALLRLVGSEGIEYARQSLLLLASPALSTVQVTVLSEREYRLLSAQEEITVRLRLDVQSASGGSPPAKTTMALRVVDADGIERHLRNVVVFGRQSSEVSLVLNLAGVTDTLQTVLSFAVDVGYPLAVLSPDRVTLRLVPERVELSVADSLLQAAYRGAEVQTTATVLVRGDPRLFPLRNLRLQSQVSGLDVQLGVELDEFAVTASDRPASLRLRLMQADAANEGERSTVTLSLHSAAVPELGMVSAQLSLLSAAAVPSTVTLMRNGEVPRQSFAAELLSVPLRLTVQDNYGRPTGLPELVLAITADNGAELTTERVTIGVGTDGNRMLSFGVRPRGLDSVVTVRVVSGLSAGAALLPPGGLRIPLQAVGELRSVRIELLGAPVRAVISTDQAVAIQLRLTPELVGEDAQMSLVLQVLDSLDEVVLSRNIVFVGEASTMTELAVTLGEGRRMSSLSFDVLRMSVDELLLPMVLSPDRVTLLLVPEAVELTVAAEQLQAQRRGGEVQTTATLSARGASQLFPLRELRLQHMVSGPAVSLIVEPEEFVLDAADSPVSVRLRLRQSYAAAEGALSTVTLTVHPAAFPQLRLDSAELVLLSAAAAPSTVTLRLIGAAPRQSQAGELLSPRLRISVRDNYGRPTGLPELVLAITAGNGAELTTSRLTVAVGPGGVGESSFGVTPRGLDSLVTVRVLSPLAMEPAEGLRFRVAAVIDIVTGDQSGLLTVGFDHACVVHRDTTVRCFGAGTLGRLGNGGTAASFVPVRVLRRLADGREITLVGIRQVVSGARYSCALAAEGSVWCWGEGFSRYAEAIPLGTGPAQLQDVKYLDVESALGCAIRATGEVWCWDMPQQPFEPQRIEAIDDALLLSLGEGYGCALTELQEVFCWGAGDQGQLGDGQMLASPDAGRRVVLENGEPLADIIRLSAGRAHTCALSVGGGVFCWGSNFAGSVSGEVKPADNSLISIVPTAVPVRRLRGGMELPLLDFFSVAAGVGFSCGIQSAAAVVRCWGSELYVGTNISYGAFGSGPPLSDRSFTITTAVLTVAEGHPALGDVRLVVASPGQLPSPSPAAPSKVWALDNFGDLWSWGVSDSIRELSIFGSAQRTPTEQELETFRNNFYYADRLGDFNIYRGGVELSSVSLTVAATVQQRRPGDALMVPVQVDAIDQDGLPYPLEVTGLRLQLSDLVNTSATDSSRTLRFVDGRAELRLELHLLQLDTDGALTLSVVGAGTVYAQQRVELRARRSNVPVFALNLQLAAGISHACVLHEDTTVRCLGNPEFGQLGRGRLPPGRLIREPLPVLRLRSDGAEIALAGMQQVVSSWNHSCALSAAGSVWCWGSALGNYAGKITFTEGPDGTAAIEDITYVDTYTSIRQLNLGIQARVCLIRRDGTIWCGFASGGPLAVKMNRIAGVSSAVQLELGELFGCAVTRSGNVFCWGIGDQGQLGNGQQLSSVDVGQQVILEDSGQPLSGIVQLTAGLRHACALGSNGRVFCWGNNADGVVSGGLMERDLHAAAVPVREVDNGVAQPLSGMGHLAGAFSYNCGIRSADGIARCWGSDFENRSVVGGGNFGRGPRPNRASIGPAFTVTTAVLTIDPGHPPLSDLLSVSACPAFGGVAALPLKVWAMDVFGDLWHWGFTVNYILSPDNLIAGEDELYANRLPNFNRYRDGMTVSTVRLTVPELVRQTDPGAALSLAIRLEAFDQFELPFPLPNTDIRLELGDLINAEADQNSHELQLEDGLAQLNLQLRLLEQGIAGEVVLRVTAAGIEYARQRVRLQALPVLSSLSMTVVEEPQPPTEIGAVVDFVVAIRAIGKDGRMIAAEDVLLSARLDGSGELLAPIGDSLALAAAVPTTYTVSVVPRATRSTTVTVSVSKGSIVASLQRQLSGVELIPFQTSIVARLSTETIVAGRDFGLAADYLANLAAAPGPRAVSVHLFYNSDLLTYTGLADVLEDDLVMTPGRVIVMADRGNQDGDPDTDRVLLLRWNAPLGIWQTVELPAQLFEALLVSRGFRRREMDTTIRLLATVDALHLLVAPIAFSILSSPVRLPSMTADPIDVEEVILAHRFLHLHEGQSAGLQLNASQLQALFSNTKVSLSADSRTAVLKDLRTLMLPEADRIMDVSGDAVLTPADTRMLLRYLSGMRGTAVFGNFDQENAERILQIVR